jgi:voltage-gated potassium channel Kch
LGVPGALVVVALVIVIRPLAVLLSVWPGQLSWRERVLLAMTAPRGIVAAAVASLAARQMTQFGVTGGSPMEGLVYLAIIVTGTWSTLAALVLPKILGYASDPSRRRAVLVGANRLTEELAQLLNDSGRTTLVVDAVSWRLDRIRSAGLATVCGDARDSVTYEEAGVERDSVVITATTNDELNLLVAELVHAEFGVENPVVALQRPPEEFGRRSRAWVDLLGGRAQKIQRWIHQLENETAEILEVAHRDETLAALLREVEREHTEAVFRLAARRAGELSFRVDDQSLQDADSLVLMVSRGRALELLEGGVAKAADQESPATAESTSMPRT